MVNSRHFEPTIDGWVVPDAPENVFRLHHENQVPLIIGNNADDGTNLATDANMTVTEYKIFIQNRFRTDAQSVLAKYPANSTAEVQLQLEQIMTDYDFTDAVKFVAGSMAELNQNTYRYQYSHVLPGQPYGAFHGSETMLLFKIPKPPDQVTDSVAENLIYFWTRFAKTGNMNGGMNITRPQYTRDEGRYLDIGSIPSVKSEY